MAENSDLVIPWRKYMKSASPEDDKIENFRKNADSLLRPLRVAMEEMAENITPPQTYQVVSSLHAQSEDAASFDLTLSNKNSVTRTLASAIVFFIGGTYSVSARTDIGRISFEKNLGPVLSKETLHPVLPEMTRIIVKGLVKGGHLIADTAGPS